ncbi:ArsR/SmtB family transcription factor [Glycomyces arizonensis]|uniref:ArsR/SmtB family transcription factor n=1 Tax=Glycomyces arizonensis TaxID=256035 RepID=UPI000553E3A2|nr:helix-turn-helix domain-containing protein [Glycomyces arizonensis]
MSQAPIEHSPAALKALSSALRRKILHHLGVHGPGNSTTIARAVDESTGTTSYHLRVLADAGLVREIPERAKGRERWWGVVRGDRRMPAPASLSEDDRLAAAALRRSMMAEDLELLQLGYEIAERDRDAAQGSRSGGYATKAELQAFHDEYLALLHRYLHPPEDAPEGAVPVVVRWYAFPDPRV